MVRTVDMREAAPGVSGLCKGSEKADADADADVEDHEVQSGFRPLRHSFTRWWSGSQVQIQTMQRVVVCREQFFIISPGFRNMSNPISQAAPKLSQLLLPTYPIAKILGSHSTTLQCLLIYANLRAQFARLDLVDLAARSIHATGTRAVRAYMDGSTTTMYWYEEGKKG